MLRNCTASSGWNVQLINEPYDPGFLDLMAARVQAHR